jgi:hypothetical protein
MGDVVVSDTGVAAKPQQTGGAVQQTGGAVQQTPAKPDRFVLTVAVSVLVAFAAFLWFMTTKASVNNEVEWNRLVYLFGGVEAIAFAAAGFLFGREVHRRQAEKAEQQAAKAEKQADKAGQRADNEARRARIADTRANTAESKGRELAVFAEAKVGASTGGKYGSLGASVAGDWSEFANRARQYFPQDSTFSPARSQAVVRQSFTGIVSIDGSQTFLDSDGDQSLLLKDIGGNLDQQIAAATAQFSQYAGTELTVEGESTTVGEQSAILVP